MLKIQSVYLIQVGAAIIIFIVEAIVIQMAKLLWLLLCIYIKPQLDIVVCEEKFLKNFSTSFNCLSTTVPYGQRLVIRKTMPDRQFFLYPAITYDLLLKNG